MATIFIDSSGDFDALTSAAVDGDSVTIRSGATAVVNQTMKFLPNVLSVYDGAFSVNGAGATSPISLLFNGATQFQMGSNGRFSTSEGWHTIGTCHGTAYSDFDLTDYWYKTTTGGSRMNDIACYLPAIWVETGRTLYFTGATGTLPSKYDYVHNTFRQATIALNSSAGTNYGPVESVGTAVGDPTSGTLVVKWMLGTNSINDPIEVRKVTDQNGVIYKTTWAGTLSQAPELRRGIFSPFQNSSGTVTGNLADITMSTMGDGPMGFQFHTYPRETRGTFGDGVNGILPAPGAEIRAPKIKLIYCNNVARRATGLSSNPLSNTAFYTGVTNYGDADLNGVSIGNSLTNINNFRSCSVNNIGCVGLSLTPIDVPTIGTWSNVVVCLPNLAQSSNLAAITVNNIILDNWYVGYRKALSNLLITGSYVKLNHSRVWQLNHLPASYTDSVQFTGYNVNNEVNDLHSHGVLYATTQTNFSVKGLISLPSLTGGTNTNTSNYMMSFGNMTGDLYIENVRLAVNSYKARQGITLASGTLDTFKIRAIGNPAYKEQWFGPAGADYLLTFSSAKIDTLDIARVFFEPNQAKYLFNQGGVSTIINSCKITDTYSGYSNSTPFIVQTKEDGYIKNAFCGYNVAITPNVVLGISSIQKAQARSFGSYMSSTTTGQIICKFYANTVPELYNNYTVIQTGTAGVIFEPQTLDYYKFKAGSIIEFAPDDYIKGHTGFTGDVNFFDNQTTVGYDWTGGTVGVYFQYDTGGTGYNNTWLTAGNPNNWTGLVVDPAVGVKIKYRLEATDIDATKLGGISTRTTTSTSAWLNNLEPIDQSTTAITLQNIVTGSRYWIYNLDSNTLITSGVASSTSVTYNVNNLPNGTNLKIRVRYASSTTKYLPFETNAITASLLANVYISQVQDTIIT
jgi:hypothetical protein